MRALAALAPVPLVPAGVWEVDASRSVVGFDVRHLRLTKVRGRFQDLAGVIRSDAMGVVSISGTIAVASIDTGDARRDARLREEDFFDAARHPTIAAKVGSAPAPPGEGRTVRGTMTIRGVERPLELHVQGGSTPVNGNGDVRIQARGSVSRRAFGLDWDPAFAGGGLVINDRVALHFDVVVVRSPHA